MTTDQVETGGNPREERVLAQLKDVKIEGVGKGRLLLTNRRLEFEKKGGFFSPPHAVFSAVLPSISSAEVDNASNTLLLKWFDESNERHTYRLGMPRGDGALSLCHSLNRALEALRQQAEQSQRRARYEAFLWRTSRAAWTMGVSLVQIAIELMREDWGAVDALLDRTVRTSAQLAEHLSPDLSGEIQSLAEAVATRDAPRVLKCSVSSLRVLGTSLTGEPSSAAEWRGLALENPNGLRWSDIRYVLLFAGMHRLMALWQEASETETLDTCLPRIAKLSSIVSEMVSSDSRPATVPQGSDLPSAIEGSARQIETILRSNAGTE